VQHAAARCAHLDAPTQQSQQGEEGPTRFDDAGHMASLHHVTHFTQKRFTSFLQDAALLHSSKGKQNSQDNSNSQPLALQNMGKLKQCPPNFDDPEGLDTFDQIPYHIGETAAAPTVPTGMKAPSAWRQRPKLLGS